MTHLVLLFYRFADIEDPSGFVEDHRCLCERLELRGRVLIASEGINGTVSGTVAACEAYMAELSTDPRLTGIEFKAETHEGHAFRALHVRERPEIIRLGRPINSKIHERTAPHLSPQEFLAMMDEHDVVLLDGRNTYESEVGRFEGALCPDVQNFRDLPDWIEAHAEVLRGKKILTYCTGGIRCEKLTTWMLEAGFDKVYQLDGGIVKYGQDPSTDGRRFLGVNVVFDDRVATSVGKASEPLTRCRECGEPTPNYVNCANVECNRRMVLCGDCEVANGRCCSPECATAPRKRRKGLKLSESGLAKESPKLHTGL